MRAGWCALVVCSCCRVVVSVLCLFLVVPWVGLWSVIVIFIGHAHMRTNSSMFFEVFYISVSGCQLILTMFLIYLEQQIHRNWSGKMSLFVF